MSLAKTTLLTGALCMALCGPVLADDPPPFPDFTFKRVKAPTPGSGPRITVQITPEAETGSRPVVQASANLPTPDVEAYDWFWAEVSPSLSAAQPGRLEPALRHLQASGAVGTPRLDDLRSILEAHSSDILLSTIGTRVSPALVLSVISIESSGDTAATSSAGAAGLMQLMPDTASRFGVSDRTDPAENIKGGVAYLDWLMAEFEGDPVLVLAAYNAGEGAVRRYEGVPPYAETRAYVPKVLAAWTVARALCQTPPDLMSDGCAFDPRGS